MENWSKTTDGDTFWLFKRIDRECEIGRQRRISLAIEMSARVVSANHVMDKYLR